MGFPTIAFDGHPRVLNVVPGVGDHDMPRFGEHFDARQGSYADCDLEFGIPIEDQARTSACGGYATGGALELLHAVETMGEVVRLSRTYVYSKVNGGQDQGSTIEALLMAAKQFGCCPYNLFPGNCLFQGQGDPRADEGAQGFRLEEGYLLTSADEVVAAISMGKPVVLGLMIGNNFDQVDGDGVSPPPDRLRGGHALLAKRVFNSKKYGPCVGGPNSWGQSFGIKGNWLAPINPYLSSTRLGAFALKGLVPDLLVA